MASTRITVRDNNRLPEIISKASQLNGAKIRVGVLGSGQQQMIATVQEYGARINVTPKMRGYLASQGLRLKKSTTVITIPERSFIRGGYDENEAEWLNRAEKFIHDAFETAISVDAVLDAMGQELRDRIRDYARDLDSPANHPFTIEKKGSSNPLVDSGGMIQAIDYEVQG